MLDTLAVSNKGIVFNDMQLLKVPNMFDTFEVFKNGKNCNDMQPLNVDCILLTLLKLNAGID